MTLDFFQGDIACVSTDAIAVGSNGLLGYGKTTSDLALAGGPRLLQGAQEVIARQGKIATGSSVIMDSGELPCRWVVYTAVPSTDDARADDFLAACYRSCLAQADRMPGVGSIAFEALASAPEGCFDAARAADIAARAVQSYMQCTASKLNIIFCLKQNSQLQCFQQAFAEVI